MKEDMYQLQSAVLAHFVLLDPDLLPVRVPCRLRPLGSLDLRLDDELFTFNEVFDVSLLPQNVRKIATDLEAFRDDWQAALVRDRLIDERKFGLVRHLQPKTGKHFCCYERLQKLSNCLIHDTTHLLAHTQTLPLFTSPPTTTANVFYSNDYTREASLSSSSNSISVFSLDMPCWSPVL